MNTRFQHRNSKHKGAALLAVLLVVFAVTLISLGFVAQSDAQLIFGRNMITRKSLDYLAETGLEHAKALILEPYDVNGLYWQGENQLQIESGDHFYNVTVNKTGNLSYEIATSAYTNNGNVTAQNKLNARLRLEPVLAYYQARQRPLPGGVQVFGDLYSNEFMFLEGNVHGSVYSTYYVEGNQPKGKKFDYKQFPGQLPNISISDYAPVYYVDGNSYHTVELTDANLVDVTLGPTPNNPAGVFYTTGDLTFHGNVQINGTVLAGRDLKFNGQGNVILSRKNFPALITSRSIMAEADNSSLHIRGLTQVGRNIDMNNKTQVRLSSTGCLIVLHDGFINMGSDNEITIEASPDHAAIKLEKSDGTVKKWSPAAGAIFESITRSN